MGKSKPFILLMFILCLLSACNRSSRRYSVASLSAEASESLYAVVCPMTDGIMQKLEQYYPSDRIGYLLPVFLPRHLKSPLASGRQYWCTIHDENGTLWDHLLVNIDQAGRIDILSNTDNVDWSGLGAYTSPDSPMYLYREGSGYYMIVEDKGFLIAGNTGGTITLDSMKEIAEKTEIVNIGKK